MSPRLLLSTAALLIAACSPAGQDASTAPRAAPQADAGGQDVEDDIREAVFRHLFGHNASALQGDAQVYCLQLQGDADPGEALLRRFTAHRPPVVKVSACRMDPARGVTERATGRRGLIFRIDSIRRSGDEAIVEGGYSEAGLSASGNRYVVRRIAGRWQVVDDDMHSIARVAFLLAVASTLRRMSRACGTASGSATRYTIGSLCVSRHASARATRGRQSTTSAR